MNEPERQIMSILGEAVEYRSPEERAAFLAKACAGDADRQARVEALVRAYESAGNFLQGDPLPRTPVATGDVPPARERPGDLIGPYRLLEQIGEGGFGVVFLAEQTEPVQRKVALKVLKPGMDTRQVVARFEAERQALAIMDHPNIAKVFDGGATPSGRPYFVMELVKGVPITEFCDQNHLTPRQRLELFIPVCEAVQHAHQKGIIHRDLKPSNVLVSRHDTTPVVKVIDFGVAKALGQVLTDKTLFTGVAQMVGTPLYMSPEQAGMSDLDIDTRSDIYSLGVLLYELLTSTTPITKERFQRAAYDEIRRIIREEEPPKPSTRLSESKDSLPSISAQRHTEPAKLANLVRGELDWIVMKALEKDRTRRYETASALALDLQRYLADEPVLACPPSAAYRLRKFARRHRGPVLAVSLVLLALLIGMIGMIWGLIRATEAEADAVLEATEKGKALGEKESALATARANEIRATAAQKEAEDNLKEAVAAVDQMLLRVGNDRLRYVPQMEALRRDLVQDAVKFYIRFLERNADHPLIRREAAVAYRRLADLHRYLGRFPEAEASYRKAFALFDLLTAQSPLEPETRNDLVSANIEFAHSLSEQGKRDEYERSIRRAVRLAGDLVREFPDDPRHGDQLASANNALASLCPPGEAERILRRNLTLTKQDWLLGHTHNELMGVLQAQGRLAEAEQAASEAARQWELTVARDPSADWAQMAHGDTLSSLADCMAANGRLQESAEIRGRALAILDRLAADYPGVHSYRVVQSWAHHKHAGVLRKLNRTADAERSYRRALELFEKVAADFPDTPGIRQTAFENRLGLGQFLAETGRPREAIEVYGAVIVPEAKGPADLPDRFNHWLGLFRTHIELGRMLRAAGKHEEAQAAYRQALAVRDRLKKEYADRAEFRRDLAGSQLDMAYSLEAAGQLEAAAATYRSAMELFGTVASRPPGTAEARLQQIRAGVALARILGVRLRHGPDAQVVIRQLTAVLKPLESDVGDNAGFRRDLARTCLDSAALLHDIDLHNVDARDVAAQFARLAVEHYGALTADPAASDDDRAGLAGALHRQGEAFRKAGKLREAEAAYKRSIGIWEELIAKSPGTSRYHEGLSWATCHHAELILPLGRQSEARDALLRSVSEGERALELSPDSASRWWIAHNYRELGMHFGGPESEKAFRRAAQLFAELAAATPPSSEFAANTRHFHADTWTRLGSLLAQTQRLDEAELAFRRALQLHEEALAELPRGTSLHNPGELLGSFTALAWFLEDRGRSAEAEQVRAGARKIRERLPQSPDSMDAWVCNEFAWALVRDRRLSVLDPAHAVRFARRAVELAPQVGNWRNTLGVALYRADDWKAALDELTRSMDLRKGGDSFDWFFLAITHQQLGHRDEARQWYERGVQWMTQHAPRDGELLRFRAEAEELLQIDKKKD
jgi:serine/threonine protein kinase